MIKYEYQKGKEGLIPSCLLRKEIRIGSLSCKSCEQCIYFNKGYVICGNSTEIPLSYKDIKKGDYIKISLDSNVYLVLFIDDISIDLAICNDKEDTPTERFRTIFYSQFTKHTFYKIEI